MRSSVSKGTKVYLDFEMAVVFHFSYIFVFIPINYLRVVRINQEVCVCERETKNRNSALAQGKDSNGSM